MTEAEVIKEIKRWTSVLMSAGRQCVMETAEAQNMAIKALDAQIKLKKYIERINQPEYKDVVWKKDEVVLLLQDLLAK